MQQVVIAGLGLIGGSLARDLHAAGLDVLGVDLDQSACQQAEAAGICRRSTTRLTGAWQWLDDPSQAMLVLAAPVQASLQLLDEVAKTGPPRLLVTDVGSTKRPFVQRAAALGLNWLGGHPMAGGTRGGFEQSRRNLFADQTYFLVDRLDDADSPRPEPVLARGQALVELLGARLEILSASRHDQLLSQISHLPQLVSSALASEVVSQVGPAARLAGNGLRQVTSLAGSEWPVWRDILLSNRDHLAGDCRRLARRLDQLAAALDSVDQQQLELLFQSAAQAEAEIMAGGSGDR